LTGARRFSQAISEGDGISVIVDVRDADGARLAQAQGAEALVISSAPRGVSAASELPVLWHSDGDPREAAEAGADAVVLVWEDDDEARLLALRDEALSSGLDYVIEVHTEEDLESALELLDPEIFLLSASGSDDEDGFDRALELLPDVPAGKLAIADVPAAGREQVLELERAGFDAVIVGARDVAELVHAVPPQV
jgi:indole-3-glycerol phosphate synthase